MQQVSDSVKALLKTCLLLHRTARFGISKVQKTAEISRFQLQKRPQLLANPPSAKFLISVEPTSLAVAFLSALKRQMVVDGTVKDEKMHFAGLYRQR